MTPEQENRIARLLEEANHLSSRAALLRRMAAEMLGESCEGVEPWHGKVTGDSR